MITVSLGTLSDPQSILTVLDNGANLYDIGSDFGVKCWIDFEANVPMFLVCVKITPKGEDQYTDIIWIHPVGNEVRKSFPAARNVVNHPYVEEFELALEPTNELLSIINYEEILDLMQRIAATLWP